MIGILFDGESMTKPVYLAVLGTSIVVAAVSLGVSLTRYLGLHAYSPKAPPAEAAPAPPGKTVAILPPEQWNNLFAPAQGMKMASRLPAANGKTGSQAPRSAFVLVGTIVSSSPDARRAILWADGMKLPKAFREKEEIEPGAFLASVERDKVWITRGKEREKLEILPVGSRTRPTTAAAPAVASPSVAPSGAPSVPGAPPPAASPDRAPPLPGIAPAPPPARTQAVTPAEASSDDGEGPSRGERRRRSREGAR